MSDIEGVPIFCDESGFTGNDLFSPDQPNFVFASVQLSHDEATLIVEEVVQRFGLRAPELKGRLLVRRGRGRDAIIWLLERITPRASVIVFEKRYSLSAKFFEYIFEPVLAPSSSLFYEINFHRFISTILYVHLIARDAYSDQLLLDFQRSLRDLDLHYLEEILDVAATSADISEILRLILTFIECHRDRIVRELETLQRSEEVGNWILELSLTALHSLLASWGEDFYALDVFCDASKPILTQGQILDVMINREDRSYIQIGMRRVPLTFNMVRPIQTVDSAQYPGIQIADVFASSIGYSLKSDNDFSRQCLAICDSIFNPNSVVPSLEHMDPLSRDTFVNEIVLNELIDRTLRGDNLLNGMGEFIATTTASYEDYILDLKSRGEFRELGGS